MDISSDDWRTKCALHRPYESNVTIVKKFNDDYYKLVTFSALRKDGFILESDLNKSKKGSVNEQKLLNNIVRAKNTIFELAMCNEWQFFVTLTLSEEKLKEINVDLSRFDLKSFYKFFANWVHHLPFKVSYLLVPEQHKNGAWHFHGFMNGFDMSSDELQLFQADDYLPTYIIEKLKSGYLVYNWVRYFDKFGFCDFEFINSQEKCSSYVTKYISKELYKTIDNLHLHCYYCSKGLNRAERIFKGSLKSDIKYDYSSDYVNVKILSKDDIDNLEFLC